MSAKEFTGVKGYTKYNKDGRKSPTQRDYLFAVHLGGLDAEKYPYCLQWSNR